MTSEPPRPRAPREAGLRGGVGPWAAAAGLVALLTLPGAAAPGPTATAPQEASPGPGRVDYVIRARVEGATKHLDGSLTLRWRNDTDRATSELWFHLYHNAFDNNRSTHLEEAGGKLRGHELVDGWGWQRVTAISARGRDLLPTLRYRSPDDRNEQDRTVFSVDLETPVQPGETIAVAIEWTAQIPRVRRRTGYKDDFLLLAHWFPKLAVFEGERGWNAHQFHSRTEFFSEYGTYDVTLDLPAKYEDKIGASGRMEGAPRLQGDRVVTRFAAPSLRDQQLVDATGRSPLVHGFAWTADPDYVKKTKTFHYDAWAEQYSGEVEFAQRALGRDKDLTLRNVEVTLLIQKEREAQWERHFDATFSALFFYGLWFGGYPYEHLTVVDPAWGAEQAGGMEYPTLFTAGTRLFTQPAMHSPESVTVYECGHQFWYGLVGNNEFEAAWLDEGFNSYTDSEVLFRRYGRKHSTTWYSGLPFDGVEPVSGPGGTVLANAISAQAIPVPWLGFDITPLRAGGFVDIWRDQPQLTFVEELTDPRWQDRARYLTDPDRDPVETAGFRYADSESYTINSYPRPAVVLRSLPAIVGKEKFLRGMRHYSELWRYRHPYPQDFYDAFNEGAGVDVSWYFDALFRGTGTVDWSVTVEQQRRTADRGFFQSEPTGEFEELAAEAAEEGEGELPEEPWEAKILVVRRGELRLPLTVELRFDDGSSRRQVWTREDQRRSRWLRIDHRGTEKLVSVALDPDRVYFLDADMSNNRWYDEVDDVTPLRWTERVFNRYLHLLHWQAGIGG